MNNSLSEVPFLEEITSILLMSWMNLWEEHHLLHDFILLETLVHKKIVLLMHSSMATLATSLPDLKSSSECLRVISVPGNLTWPMVVSVVHTNTVDLFFITFDTVWGTNIISEKPGFCLFMTLVHSL
jgi:hypothetical protein